MAAALALALAPTAALSAQAPAAGGPMRAFLEVDGLPARAWVGQVCEVVVRVGLDAAWFADSAVPLSAQALDQPVHVQAPWLGNGDEARAVVVAPAAGAPTQRLAVGDRAESFTLVAPRTVDGRQFPVLELRVRWQPRRQGVHELPPVRLRYAYATQFVDDFLRGRQPRDRQEAALAAASATVAVAALPADAPAAFTGAVGRFSLTATPVAARAEVGRPLAVTATLAGDGNFGDFAFMPAAPLPGLHVDGVVAVPDSGGRSFRLDVLPVQAGLAELPSVSFCAFDPVAGAYVTVAAPAAPLAVDPASARLSPRVQRLVDAAAALAAADAPSPSRWLPPLAALLAALMGSALGRRWRRHARMAALLAARGEFLGTPEGDSQLRLHRFRRVLAAAIAAPQWRDDGFEALGRRLPADVVAALRAHLQALEAACYGGPPPPHAAVAATLGQLTA
jgi:hypothetical protein